MDNKILNVIEGTIKAYIQKQFYLFRADDN